MDASGLGTSAALAVFLVPLVSFVKKPTWSYRVNYLIGMVVALVCAIVGALADGHVNNLSSAVAYFGTALATSQTIYSLYFKDTNLETKLEDM